MKKILFFIIFISFFGQNLAQDFAPIGAEWHYDERFAFDPSIDYIKFTSVKDTFIFGEICRKITKRHKVECNNRPDTEYLFTRNDTVFFLDTAFNCFQILYDFNALINDSWMILVKSFSGDTDSLTVTVNSVSTSQINGKELKAMDVTYSHTCGPYPRIYNSNIIERIGDIQYMFNWLPDWGYSCDINNSNGLRCYQDDFLGLYSTGIADSCDYFYYSWLDVDHNNVEYPFSVHPNPFKGIIKIESYYNKKLKIIITDLTGNIIIQRFFSGTTIINLSEYQNGIYIINVYKNNQIIETKKIIKINAS